MSIQGDAAALSSRFCTAFFLFFLLIVTAEASNDCTILRGQDDRRIAIVVGNGAYPPSVGRLANPVNDARAIAATLQELDFSVALVLDGSEQTISECLDRGLELVERPEVALFHFSGHGIQFDDNNFLVATDADVSTKPMRGFVRLQPIIEKMQRRADAVLVFLDACRDNPLADQNSAGLSVSSGRGIKRGTDPVSTSQTDTQLPKGTLIAFATSPNAVALDGDGSFSPFSQAILEHLATPGYSVQRVMSLVTRAVGESTDWAQTPWVRSSLNRELKLAGDFSLDKLQAASRNWAETAIALNEKGRRKEAILAALKGLPEDQRINHQKYFPEAMSALYTVIRSDRTWIDPKGSVFTIQRSANGGAIALSIQTEHGIMVQVWDALKHRQVLEIPTGHVSYSLDPNGARLAVSSPPGKVSVWDIAARKIITSFSSSPLPVAGQIKWSPDGKLITVSNAGRVTLYALPEYDGSSGLSPGQSIQINGVEASFGDEHSVCAVRKNGERLSVGWVDLRSQRFAEVGEVTGHDTFIRIWCDRKTGALGLVYTENIDDTRATAWFGDGPGIDVDLDGLHAMVLTVSPDQRWLALANNTGNITHYSAVTGEIVASPFAEPGYSGGYGHVYYGPDGGTGPIPSYETPPVDVWRETPTGRQLVEQALSAIDADQREQLAAERIVVNR